jgi:hypothetical protein
MPEKQDAFSEKIANSTTVKLIRVRGNPDDNQLFVLSADDSSVDTLKKLVAVHNRILSDEVRDHAAYAKVLLATGFGLTLLGFLIITYYAPLGLLLILVGILRSINSIYDFKRGDTLKRKMRLVRQEFGDVLALSLE